MSTREQPASISKRQGQATARRERANSVAASDHSSERRQHRVGIRIDSPSGELPAFDSTRPSSRECSVDHDEIEDYVAIEHERTLLVDGKVFNPVFVEHALQIDRSDEFPLARWWIVRRHNVSFVYAAINVRQAHNEGNKRLPLTTSREIALHQMADRDASHPDRIRHLTTRSANTPANGARVGIPAKLRLLG
jgi:hypothetical protein